MLFSRRRLIWWLLCLVLPLQVLAVETPTPLLRLLTEDLALPRYHEAYYHPLGRNPVLDAVLGDPLYLPTYGRSVSQALRNAAERISVERVLTAALHGGAVPVDPADFRGWLRDAGVDSVVIPGLDEALGALDARSVTRAWQLFLLARSIAETELDKLGAEERARLLVDPEAYLFGEEPTGEYQYFTHDTTLHTQIFTLAARLDLAELARAQRCLGFAVDLLQSRALGLDNFKGNFEWTAPGGTPGEGARLLISGAADDLHDTDADFLIDVGGDDIYRNNAGGTRGVLPAALLLDMAGHDRYEGDFAVQGGGFLGVAALVDFAGDDTYQAVTFSQGAAWFGSGMLIDLKGRDEYRADLFVQSAAAYGNALLWDADGDDTYEAAGFAQAASTTLGTAFLVESSGDDRYRCGRYETEFWTRQMGIGQGGAVGLRDYPWKTKPAFYGGVAFLDDAAGDDDLYCPAFCQGGGYVFGVGILVNSGGNDHYANRSEGLGAVVHLAAGLMLKEGGNDTYDGIWGSTGVGGDRGVGIFIDTGGDDRHLGGRHNIGTARKPKAVGLFCDLAGNDTYRFEGESGGRVQRPRDPEQWPRALFLDLGGRDIYPDDDLLARGDNLSWDFAGFGAGLDTTLALQNPTATLFEWLPEKPRIDFPFDPLLGWSENIAHRPLLTAPRDSLARQDSTSTMSISARTGIRLDALSGPVLPGYDARRRLYEQIDLARFESGGDGLLPDALMSNLALAPVDLIAWAALWAELDSLPNLSRIVGQDLLDDRIISPYARRLLIRAVGVAPPGEIAADSLAIYDFSYEAMAPSGEEILRNRLLYDPDSLCRREAALALGRQGGEENLAALSRARADSAAVVRYSICRGLRDSAGDGVLALVEPYFDDGDLSVRRQAFVTAISVGHKEAIDKLLKSLEITSLDTGENYGHNLYATLAQYVGRQIYEDNGVELSQWRSWWRRVKRSFDLPAAIKAENTRRQTEESDYEDN